RILTQREAGLFFELTSDSGISALTRIDASSRQSPLTRMGSEGLRAAGQQKAGATAVVRQKDQCHGRRAASVGRHGAPLEQGQVRLGASAQRITEPVVGRCYESVREIRHEALERSPAS